jgi:leucyl aminopeptidase
VRQDLLMLDVRIAAPTVDAPLPDDPVVEDDDPAVVREAAGRIGRDLPAGRSVLARPGLAGARLTAFVEGLVLGSYRYSLATRPADRPTVVDLIGVTDHDAVAAGLRHAQAGTWARDLANTPAQTKTPAWLGAQARRRLGPLGVHVAVHDETWLSERGFGGVLAVGAGSAAPPRLIAASWRPRGARPDTHVVLVGKGITFDTGGLNLKPGDGMRAMKTDMSGGAAVLGALWLAAEQRLPVRVTALVPAAENSISGSAYRPSDVVRHVGGRTSEIGNTDAEGRVVLADAMAYAVARLRPTSLVDVATLTGAMKIALGLRTGGMFATDDRLAKQLIAAGAAAGEPLWRMPLVDEYEPSLESSIADATNSPGSPGAITAALFLRPFAGDVPWAHLDVAGPARAGGNDGIRSTGATGFGARLLGRWLEALA